jgi:hypothetical protein
MGGYCVDLTGAMAPGTAARSGPYASGWVRCCAIWTEIAAHGLPRRAAHRSRPNRCGVQRLHVLYGVWREWQLMAPLDPNLLFRGLV